MPANSFSRTLPSDVEAEYYYAGLPSGPRLVARTGDTPWVAPTGAEAYRVTKELRPVGNHAIADVWEDNLAFRLHAILDSAAVKWTSTDVVRIGRTGESLAPVILWIGVEPLSMSPHRGVHVASSCHMVLMENGITDVDVEIRESSVIRYATVGPTFFVPSSHPSHPVTNFHDPLSTALGTPIAAQSTPDTQGTAGFFIGEGGKTDRLLLVTARHVLFDQRRYTDNTLYEYRSTSQPRHKVVVFGATDFDEYLTSIGAEIENQKGIADYLRNHIELLAAEEKDDPVATQRDEWQAELKRTTGGIDVLTALEKAISKQWSPLQDRVIGHVIVSPPIRTGAGPEGYTEDWAVIEVDSSKINQSNFRGNVIYLGTDISPVEFSRMIRPKLEDKMPFTYPVDRLLKLRGTIPDDEMRKPKGLDINGQHCIMVLKRGRSTGLTIGCANNIISYARGYLVDAGTGISKEWAIFPRDSKAGVFSEEGDSGAAVVDGQGRIGGIITGGSGVTPVSDITYATPAGFLLRRMQENGLEKPDTSPTLASAT